MDGEAAGGGGRINAAFVPRRFLGKEKWRVGGAAQRPDPALQTQDEVGLRSQAWDFSAKGGPGGGLRLLGPALRARRAAADVQSLLLA